MATATITSVGIVLYLLPAPSNNLALQSLVVEGIIEPEERRIVRIEVVRDGVPVVEIAEPDFENKTSSAADIEVVPEQESVEALVAEVEVGLAVQLETEELAQGLDKNIPSVETSVYTVPFFSQFTDITPVEWRKVGCGIASLAMLIDFYNPGQVSVDTLLQDGIRAGYFLSNEGWIHSGLINLSKEFGLDGQSYSFSHLGMDAAFTKLEKVLEAGPVMVSVHYTFDPANPIPHLVVVNGISDGKVFYNDPAEDSGSGAISITQFQSAWKKRYIEIRPT